MSLLIFYFLFRWKRPLCLNNDYTWNGLWGTSIQTSKTIKLFIKCGCGEFSDVCNMSYTCLMLVWPRDQLSIPQTSFVLPAPNGGVDEHKGMKMTCNKICVYHIFQVLVNYNRKKQYTITEPLPACKHSADRLDP